MISDNSTPDNARVIAHPDLKPCKVSPSSASISFRYTLRLASAAEELNGASITPPWGVVGLKRYPVVRSICNCHDIAKYCSIALTGHIVELELRLIPNTLLSPSLRVFPHTWLNKSPSSFGNLKISGTLTWPISPSRSPLKKTLLKYAWSRAKIKCCNGVDDPDWIHWSRYLASRANWSTKKGVACLGVTRAWSCSVVTRRR